MAGYRQLHYRMWAADSWFSTLEPEQKLLFIYLFSNERASMCGLYEIPLRLMMFETGLEEDQVTGALQAFAEAGKVKYDFNTGMIWVKNMWKYQGSRSPKVEARIKADINAVPECELKAEAVAWLSKDIVSIQYGNCKDTPVYISFSIKEEGVKGGGEKPPILPEEGDHSANIPADEIILERVWNQATGFVTFFGSTRAEDMRRIEAVYNRNGWNFDKTVADLRLYFEAWCNTISPKTHRKYKPTNTGWLDWAVAGQVNDDGSKPETEDQRIARALDRLKP